jgi:hypothetical protein
MTATRRKLIKRDEPDPLIVKGKRRHSTGNAYRVRYDMDLQKLVEDLRREEPSLESHYLRIRIYARDAVTGIGRVFDMHYQNLSQQIICGQFSEGNQLGILPEAAEKYEKGIPEQRSEAHSIGIDTWRRHDATDPSAGAALPGSAARRDTAPHSVAANLLGNGARGTQGGARRLIPDAHRSRSRRARMNWRDTAFIPDGGRPSETDIDSIVSKLPAAQQVRMACWVRRFMINLGADLPGATVVLTDQSLIVAKSRFFGSARPGWIYKLDEIERWGWGPLRGVGPAWEVQFEMHDHGILYIASMYFAGPTQAEPVARELGAAVNAARDPDVEET